MASKEELVSYIKEWIEIDNQQRQIQNEMKEKRERKKMLSNALVDIMKTNEIDSFDIKGGSLLYKQTKVKAPITKKNLMNILTNYFKSEDQAGKLSEFILENREESIRESIHRKISK